MLFLFSLIGMEQCNIRVLGGLVSAHILATDSTNRLVQGTYKNQLLDLAEDLGRRFLPAFDTPTGLPYAWINLKVTYVPSNDMQNCATSFFRRNALLIHKRWTTGIKLHQHQTFDSWAPTPRFSIVNQNLAIWKKSRSQK